MIASGLVLLVLGAALAVAEVHVISYGLLSLAAAVCVALGLTLTIAGSGASLAVGLAVGLAAGGVCAVFAAMVVSRVLTLRRTPVRGGVAGLLGRRGELRSVPDPVGRVLMDGALWRARAWSSEEGAEMHPGDPVVVEHVDGLTLTVRRAEEWEVAP